MNAALGAVFLFAASGCGDDEPPPAAASPTATTVEVGPPPAPAHGGTVVTAGPHFVEVLPHASGEVYAYVHGDAPPVAETELHVEVPVEGGATRRVALEWDRRDRRYEGRVRGVTIVTGPTHVHLTVGPTVYLGTIATIVILPAVVVVDVHHDHRKHHKHRKHRKHRDHGGVVIEVH